MRLFVVFIVSVVLFACNPKQNKEIISEEKVEVLELKKVIDETPKKVVFCKKIFERQEKISFINNVYMAFVKKDSTLIKPHINTAVSVSLENTTLSGFDAKSISKASLTNWTSFVNEIAPNYGVSVCDTLDNTAAHFKINSCWEDNKGKANTAYLKYIHFEKIKGQYFIKGIGFYNN